MTTYSSTNSSAVSSGETETADPVGTSEAPTRERKKRALQTIVTSSLLFLSLPPPFPLSVSLPSIHTYILKYIHTEPLSPRSRLRAAACALLPWFVLSKSGLKPGGSSGACQSLPIGVAMILTATLRSRNDAIYTMDRPAGPEPSSDGAPLEDRSSSSKANSSTRMIHFCFSRSRFRNKCSTKRRISTTHIGRIMTGRRKSNTGRHPSEIQTEADEHLQSDDDDDPRSLVRPRSHC
jgi:hypothetical protein